VRLVRWLEDPQAEMPHTGLFDREGVTPIVDRDPSRREKVEADDASDRRLELVDQHLEVRHGHLDRALADAGDSQRSIIRGIPRRAIKLSPAGGVETS
jgi:hypothetical protein